MDFHRTDPSAADWAEKCSRFAPYGLYAIGTGALRAEVTGLGATLVSLRLDGQELALNHPSAEAYYNGRGYIGAIVGRYANRIAGARFTLNGVTHQLIANEGAKCIHGGPRAFSFRQWEVVSQDENSITFLLVSPDGDNGFPGTLRATVTYVVEGDRMKILFGAETDRDTVYNPTTHAYFCLGGGTDVRDAVVSIDASGYVLPDGDKLPVAVVPAEGDFDFSAPRTVKNAYDHCFVLNADRQGPAFTASYGGVKMEMDTDFPGIQFYTGAGLHEPHAPFEGFAAEPGYYPDSPNHEEFPSCVLHEGERFSKFISYRFYRA